MPYSPDPNTCFNCEGDAAAGRMFTARESSRGYRICNDCDTVVPVQDLVKEMLRSEHEEQHKDPKPDKTRDEILREHADDMHEEKVLQDAAAEAEATDKALAALDAEKEDLDTELGMPYDAE